MYGVLLCGGDDARTTFVAQHLRFAAVMADAAMVYEFVWQAVYRVARRAAVVGRS